MLDHNKTHLQELLSNLVDEKLGEGELKELQALLRDDPDAQQFYIKYTMLHSWLTWDYIGQSSAESRLLSLTKQEVSDEPGKTSPILGFLGDIANYLNHHSPLSFILLIALFGATLLTATHFLSTRPTQKRPAESGIVAQITSVKDCQWSAAIPSPAQNMPLLEGRLLQLEKGIAQITYTNGAVVLLEGPASLTLDSSNSGFLSQGKLTARADTDESRQFTILTPDARFVDLGTEFGVKIDEQGRAEVAVFAGKVNAEAKLADGHWDTPVALKAGEAVVCVEAKFSPYVAQRSSFPSLRPLPPPPPSLAFQHWLDVSRKLQSYPDLVAYYDFQPDPSNPSVLFNRAPTGAALNGEIMHAPWVNGRFPGKSALEFLAGDSGVRINLPGEYPQMTLIAWISSNKLANDINSILNSDSWKRPKELHWEILEGGQMQLIVFGQKDHQESPPIPTDILSRWCMVTGVIDTAAGQISYYLNGEYLDKFVSNEMPVINIGSATIGGWDNQGKGDSNLNRTHNLSGRIDEMMIFQKVLSANDIKQIYEAGKP
jgi:Concanavalin A-like lectin/glucanases superfamily/FecR protein